MNTNIHFRSYIAQFFLEWKLFRTEVIEKLETHILCSANFFENGAVYEIMWKNTVDWGRPQIVVWRMHIACWIPKATNTHRLCNTHCFSTATMVAWTRFSVTLHIQCLYCWCLFAYPARCHLKVDLYVKFLSSCLLMLCPKSIIRCSVNKGLYVTYRENPQVSGTCCLVPGCLQWPTACTA
jgi:hypothetical protein